MSECAHMGPRPTRRLVVGDTEASEEITSEHNRRKKRGQLIQEQKDGDMLAQAGDDCPLRNLSFRFKD